MKESAPPIDLLSALALLLTDTELRTAFATDRTAVAEKLGLREPDRSTFVHLTPNGLNAQARVLHRKRFEVVRSVARQTCEALGDLAWINFERYARSTWLKPGLDDALYFCLALQEDGVPACPADINRLRFAVSGKWLRLHVVPKSNGTKRRCLQVLFRFAGRNHELSLFFQL